ncbi:MAG: hypothetical protein KA028_00500 [Candidatus Pacebacteria bacterium]|nr:hypothetical protein [Candidatus Paceibacterota bacterium]MBP9851684.1 hypothetical protein [Candidatus Paceibacterota bacterium]
MVNKVILDYIHSEFNRGVPKETIRQMLIESGWQLADVDEAERIAYATPAAVPQPAAPQATNIPISREQNTRPFQSTAFQNNTQQNAMHNVKPANLMAALDAYKQKTAPAVQPAMQQFTQPAVRPLTQPAMQKPAVPLMERPMQANPASLPVQPTMQTQNPFDRPVSAVQPIVHGKSHWRSLKVVFAILFVLVAGAAVYGYFTGYFISVAKMSGDTFAAITESKGATFDAAISIDMTNVKDDASLLTMLPGYSPNISFAVQGSYSKDESKNLLSNASFAFAAGTFSINANTKLTADNLYVYTTEVPPLALFDLANYKNQWLSVPVGEAADGTEPIPVISDIVSDLSKVTQFADIAASSTNLITISQRFMPETIDGVEAYHFGFTINNDPSLNDTLGTISNSYGEAWIGKADHLPRKITLAFDSQEGPDPASLAKVSMVMTFTQWGNDITVEAPTESIPFSTIVESSLAQEQVKSFDEELSAKLVSLQGDAEVFFDANTLSYKNFCKSPSVAASFAEKMLAGCRDAVGSYVIYSKLSAENSGFYCVDATNTGIEIEKAPTGLACQ